MQVGELHESLEVLRSTATVHTLHIQVDVGSHTGLLTCEYLLQVGSVEVADTVVFNYIHYLTEVDGFACIVECSTTLTYYGHQDLVGLEVGALEVYGSAV